MQICGLADIEPASRLLAAGPLAPTAIQTQIFKWRLQVLPWKAAGCQWNLQYTPK